MEYSLQLPDLTHVRTFAAGLAASLKIGDVIAFSGPVGSGKTTLTREIVRYLTGFDSASSPSFGIWQQYEGVIPVNHLDLYRIENPAELPELGLEEAFDGKSITIVEWPERAPQLLPVAILHITIEGSGDEPRRVTLQRR
jgi:tRNA threonylcarbamoyladenosine biosynthesis protein TsaE